MKRQVTWHNILITSDVSWLSLLFCIRSCPKKQNDKNNVWNFLTNGQFKGLGGAARGVITHHTKILSKLWKNIFINKNCHKPPSPPFWRSSSWNQEGKCKMNKNNGSNTYQKSIISKLNVNNLFKQKFYTIGGCAYSLKRMSGFFR